MLKARPSRWKAEEASTHQDSDMELDNGVYGASTWKEPDRAMKAVSPEADELVFRLLSLCEEGCFRLVVSFL